MNKEEIIMPIDYAGNDQVYTTISVHTSGKIWNRTEKKVLDEQDSNSNKFANWLRNQLLPKGGRAKIDSYGNVYLRGKLSAELDYVPVWVKENKEPVKSLESLLEGLWTKAIL